MHLLLFRKIPPLILGLDSKFLELFHKILYKNSCFNTILDFFKQHLLDL
jgi:hypothetical protein